MTDTKHTPGPWRLGIRQPTSDKFIYGQNGEEIADCDMINNFPENNLANARLIAAAPDLLNAVEHLLLIAMETASEDNIVIIAAEHAIAKAYGVIE